MMSLVPFRRIMNSSCSISKEPIMTTTATIMFALFIVIGAAAGGGVCEVDAFSFLESSSSSATTRSSSAATSGSSSTRISMRISPSSNTYKNRGQGSRHRSYGWMNDHHRSGNAARISPTSQSQSSSMMMLQLSSSSSSESSFEVNVQTPTQEEAESFGIREWSQQARQQGTFVETVADATTTTTRYVLEGEGQLTVVSSSATTTTTTSNKKDNDNKTQVVKLRPGTLVEVTGGGGDVQLNWDITSKEMILLTPGFEEIGLFVGVIVGFVGLVGALVTLS
mmetsp:Transcript_4752/g.12071  ORF Transcript_4752/g.12071 Transcript_4752/m.12071 type:complete len:280 (+) Transcript_4752:3-842(+)